MRIKKVSQYIEGGAGLPSYFTDEIDTGMKWIDGKPIYRKVINVGALPNNSEKTIAHNISNIDNFQYLLLLQILYIFLLQIQILQLVIILIEVHLQQPM